MGSFVSADLDYSEKSPTTGVMYLAFCPPHVGGSLVRDDESSSITVAEPHNSTEYHNEARSPDGHICIL